MSKKNSENSKNLETPEWLKFQRSGVIEMRPYVEGESLDGISVSEQDTPAHGGMIARNPDNHVDQWYVAADYYMSRYSVMQPQPQLTVDPGFPGIPVAKLNGHQVNPANDWLEILVMDEMGAGGMHHHYRVIGFEAVPPSRMEIPPHPDAADVIFQNGPIAEAGVNGLTHEVLLEIVAHRLECFSKWPYSTCYNVRALSLVRQAQDQLHQRTRERMARGVEGTHEK